MSIEAQLSELTAAIRENTTVTERMIAALGATAATTTAAPADAAPADAEPVKPKAKGRPTKTDVGVTKVTEPAPKEVSPEVEEQAEVVVDMQMLRAMTKSELLAYRDAVRDGEPASADPGDAVKAGVAAARNLLTPFKAAKFDDVKDDDLSTLRDNIKAAHAALTAEPADTGSDIDLDI